MLFVFTGVVPCMISAFGIDKYVRFAESLDVTFTKLQNIIALCHLLETERDWHTKIYLNSLLWVQLWEVETEHDHGINC